MKELPIVFKPDMHRMIRKRLKTQTRRLIEPQPMESSNPGNWNRCAHYCTGSPDKGWAYYWQSNGCWNSTKPFQPKYQPGDRLWVREAFADYTEATPCRRCGVIYEPLVIYRLDFVKGITGVKWKSPIHMPKWAARTWLEVTDVRPERLNDISEEDAKAEGVYKVGLEWVAPGVMMTCVDGTKAIDWPCHSNAREAFKTLWGSSGEWYASPWVWAYTFKLIQC